MSILTHLVPFKWDVGNWAHSREREDRKYRREERYGIPNVNREGMGSSGEGHDDRGFNDVIDR
jgi:hypothetical protein